MGLLDGGLRSLTRRTSEPLTVGDLAVEVPVLAGDTTCEDLDRVFGRSARGSCAVVRHPDLEGVIGLVERGRFEALMSGPYGYGRSLYGRRPVAEVAQWDALTVTPDTSVVEASSRAITRPAEHVQDHVLVQEAGSVRALPMPLLLSALARDLADQALRDPLTRLANREAFFGRVEESCRRSATQPGHQTAVLYLDLDGFKAVNDTLGHDRGDALLCEVAVALTDVARPADLVARLGGDEFAVCLDVETDGPGHPADSDTAQRIARRMHEAVARLTRDGAVASRVRVSVGVAVTAGGRVDPRSLIRAADLAMYRGKRDGGDAVTGPVVVTTSVDADPLLGTSIEEAVARGELELLYQPIVALEDGRLASLEALVRWRHPRLGLLTPDAFLPAVQRAGQLIALDDWVLRTAMREFAAWAHAEEAEGRDRPVALNVNVSTDRLLAAGLSDVLDAAAAEAGMEPSLVRIEVPEQLLVDQLEAATEALARVSRHGFKVTLDDVGAGGTSLRHLREVRADGLKIDRSYVQRLLTDDRDRALVRMLVDFAVGTGIAVTAEGVESLEQRDALLELGCHYAQGWLFSRPAPLSAARAPAGPVPV
ncbi:putative bifunctional diguanylate cyclase/phosphodiesterase [Blastococcus sp. SYSU DS0619]